MKGSLQSVSCITLWSVIVEDILSIYEDGLTKLVLVNFMFNLAHSNLLDFIFSLSNKLASPK